MKEKWNELLKSIYYDETHPASYGSVKNLFIYAKEKDKSISLKDVKEWLSGENAYTLHRDARKKFKRNKIFVTKPLEQYQADLVDMQKFSRSNKGYRYILTVIDCFSRYAFAEPVKNKTPSETIRAFKEVFKKGRPFKLQTDKGNEFKGAFKRFLEDNNVKHFFTNDGEFKCAIVERFNRTLKNKMYKYFTAKQTKRYIEVLPKLVESYNNSKHRTIGIAPAQVSEENQNEVFKKIYNANDMRDYFSKDDKNSKNLGIGDKVRLKYALTSMDKGYLPKWTDRIYTIKRNVQGNTRPMYALEDYRGDDLIGRFYPEEVQKVKENFYRIEKIIRKEEKDGRKGFIVKWIDHPSKDNSWVAEEDFVDFTKNG